MSGQIRFSSKFMVVHLGGDMLVDVIESAGLDLSKLDFWYKITDATARKLTVNGGMFTHALSEYDVPATAGLVANTSPAYPYLQYTRGAVPTVQITGDPNVAKSDANTYRRRLFTFSIVGGNLVLSNIHNMGAIEIGSYWA